MEKSDAINLGTAAKSRLKGGGWNLHVWQENVANDDSLGTDMQWVFEIRNQSVRVIPESPEARKFVCIISVPPREGVDDILNPQLVIGQSGITFEDPNAAVTQAVMDASNNMAKMSKLFRQAHAVLAEMKNDQRE